MNNYICPRCKSQQTSVARNHDSGILTARFACGSVLQLTGFGSSWEKEWTFECSETHLLQNTVDSKNFRKYVPYKDD